MRGKKDKGAITLFLTIILVSMILFVIMLIDASRAVSARTDVKRAAQSGLRSVLAGYDRNIKDDYGLFTVHDFDSVEEELSKYIYDSLVKKNGQFQMYTFNLSDGEDHEGMTVKVEVEPVFDLLSTDVMEYQIMEYMKYRAPISLAEEVLGKFKTLSSISEKSELMQKKIEIDRKLAEYGEDLKRLSNYTQLGDAYSSDKGKHELPFELIIKNLGDKETIFVFESKINDENRESYEKDIAELENDIVMFEKDIYELDDLVENIRGHSSNYIDAKELAEDLIKESEEIVKEIDSQIDKISESELSDEDFYRNLLSEYESKKEDFSKETLENVKSHSDYNAKLLKIIITAIDSALTTYEEYSDDDMLIAVKQKIGEYETTIEEKNSTFREIEYIYPDEVSESIEIDEEMTEDVTVEDNSAEKATISSDDIVIPEVIRAILPSKAQISNDTQSAYSFDVYETDEETGAEKALEWLSSSGSSFPTVFGEEHIRKLYIDEYVLSTFKSRMVSDEKNRDIAYFDDSEVEYVISGKMSRDENLRSVYSKIFTIRLGANMISLYTLPPTDSKSVIIDSAALTLAGMSGGQVWLKPIYKSLIIFTWAGIESGVDMKWLLTYEDEENEILNAVPFFKLPNEWHTAIDGKDIKNFIETVFSWVSGENVSIGSNLEPESKPTDFDYTDYLRILLFMEGNEEKLPRIQDLIQLNIYGEEYDKKTYPEPPIMKNKTNIKVTVDVSFDYLIVPDELTKNGDGRYHETFILYEGY